LDRWPSPVSARYHRVGTECVARERREHVLLRGTVLDGESGRVQVPSPAVAEIAESDGVRGEKLVQWKEWCSGRNVEKL
jgi:hypothetical protein